MKIDKRKKYILAIDTETVQIGETIRDSLVYDIGYAIVDKKGNVYETGSFVVAEVFLKQELMETAYYAEKIPNYVEDINNGKRKIAYWRKIRQQILAVMRKYNCNTVMAHNASFDCCVLNKTEQAITGYRFYFPYGTIWWDTLKMAHDVIMIRPTYRRFCEKNGYMTNHKTPRPRLTAEILYRYLTGDNEFIESHTGLEDVLIEKEIFATCVRQHKKMRKLLFEK